MSLVGDLMTLSLEYPMSLVGDLMTLSCTNSLGVSTVSCTKGIVIGLINLSSQT